VREPAERTLAVFPPPELVPVLALAAQRQGPVPAPEVQVPLAPVLQAAPVPAPDPAAVVRKPEPVLPLE